MVAVSADDPYYCGFSARVPNFVKQGKQKQAASSAAAADKPAPHQQQQLQQHGGGAHQSRDRDGGRSGGPKYRETSVLPPPAPAQVTRSYLAPHYDQVLLTAGRSRRSGRVPRAGPHPPGAALLVALQTLPQPGHSRRR